MFGVDKRRHTTGLLHFGNTVQRHRRLPGGLRAKNLNDPSTWQSSDSKRNVERQRAGRNRRHVSLLFGSQLHDRAFPVLLLNLGKGEVERSLFVFFFGHRNLLESERT